MVLLLRSMHAGVIVSAEASCVVGDVESPKMREGMMEKIIPDSASTSPQVVVCFFDPFSSTTRPAAPLSTDSNISIDVRKMSDISY